MKLPFDNNNEENLSEEERKELQKERDAILGKIFMVGGCWLIIFLLYNTASYIFDIPLAELTLGLLFAIFWRIIVIIPLALISFTILFE